jgi:hypothetical protein
MPVTTRQMQRMEPILAEPPLAGMEEMMQRALDIVRFANKAECKVCFEQLKEFKICKASLTRFSHIPNMEKHFLKHHVVNEQLLKLMDEMFLIVE